MGMNRRQLLSLPALAALKPQPVVLVRSGWQTENIGDIAHTPGLLALVEKHLGGARLVLWSNALDRGVDRMLRKRFPQVRVISGEPGGEAVDAAFKEASFLLHGSGPSLVARQHVEAWRAATGKPWGAFGITVAASGEAASAALDEGLRDLLSSASFIYTRETRSLENLRAGGVKGPALDFVPDATFSVDLRDESVARAYLATNGLEPGKFLCVVPRLRYTPYHKMRKVNWTEETIRKREEANAAHAEEDHAKFRAAMVTWVRSTEYKVLLCPEMTYELEIMGPLLYDPLPGDVRPQVVRRTDYWITDEAASVYANAAAVLSFECHSPILACAMGTPALYVHQPEDGIKVQMWDDVGLGANTMEVERTSAEQLSARIKYMAASIKNERKRVREAVEKARKVQQQRMESIKRTLGA